jgi:hypothetical protein
MTFPWLIFAMSSSENPSCRSRAFCDFVNSFCLIASGFATPSWLRLTSTSTTGCRDPLANPYRLEPLQLVEGS